MRQLDGAFFYARDVAALERRREIAQRIDIRKLDRLRARHTARHAAVAAFQQQQIEAAHERALQRRAIGYGDHRTEAFLRRPLAEIANASAEELEAAGIRDFAAFDAWTSACQRLAITQERMKDAAADYRQSGALLERLERYAQEVTR